MSSSQPLVVTNDLTIYHALELKPTLLDALANTQELELNLSQVSEMDTAGLQLLILLCTTLFTDVIVMHGYAFLASRAQRWLATAKARRAQNRVFGGVLIAMGAGLFMVKRAA